MNTPADSLLAWKSVAVFAWLALLFGLERLWPAAHEPAGTATVPGGWRRLLRNGALWLCTTALSLAVVVPVSVWATQHDLGLRPDAWSGWWAVAVDVVLLDGLIYWWHRFNHEWPFLWRFHEVHHLDRFLDSTSALRFHFGEVLLSALARAAIIVVFGIPLVSVLVFETLVLIGTIFHHSNLRLPPRFERALSYLVVTPSIHWVHHHAVRADTDSNYATVLSVWDRLFGSRSPNPRRLDMAIGVERRDEKGMIALLIRPFLPASSRDA